MREVFRTGFRQVGKTVRGMAVLVLLLLVLAIGVDGIGAFLFRAPPILTFVLHDLPFRGVAFDPQTWAAAQSCAELSDRDCDRKQARCLRGGMVRDLLTTSLRPGSATRRTVASVIGRAEHEVRIAGQDCDAYALGMCSGLRLDYDSLFVCYGADGRVDRAGHIQH